ncbi:MAG TPA: ABC transporter permease [Chloroflexia bacterium]|nr:ABC transporter permease [Chloroflexia bacterium]
MKKTLYITQRELYAYFASPIAYIMMAFFLAFSGALFSLIFTSNPQSAEANTVLRSWSGTVGFFLLIFVSIITIRLIAEEQKTGTMELLLTSPIRDWEVVVGKFLATLAVILLTLVLTLFYLLLMLVFGGRPDWGPVLSAYLGLILLGGTIAAVGMLASALTESQAVAAVIGFLVSIVLWYLGALFAQNGPTNSEWWSVALNYASLSSHVDSFSRGSPELKDILYFLTLIVLFLGVTVQVLRIRRAE